MKASVVACALRTMIAARQPVFLWGGPGIGKSAVVGQAARSPGLELRDIRALLLDPVDLRGLPFLGEGGWAEWATPCFLPRDGAGIVFLDELNAAPAMVQAACYQLVLDRRLGEYWLPEGWTIIAAVIAIRIGLSQQECRHRCGTGSLISSSKSMRRNGRNGPSRRR